MKKFLVLFLSLPLIVLLLTTSASAQPAEGALLASFNSNVSGVGVGFDGQFLYLPNFAGTSLSMFQTDGTPAGGVPIVGCRATVISWDATRGVFWGASGTTISQITTAGACTPQFSVAGKLTGNCDTFGCLSLIDGIDYDPSDDSIWYTPDASQRVYHFDTAGNPKPVGAGPNHFFDVNDAPNDMIAECGFNYSSGVGTGADPNAIYLAANGCDTIFRYDKQTGAKVNSFVIPAQRNEDLECDDVTFANQGVDAFWIKDIVGPVQAFAVPKGLCVSIEVDPVEVSKDYRFTDVCFEQDNDADSTFNEDPVDFDADDNPIDNDGDGLFNEDLIDCPDGTSLGDPLPVDPDSEKFLVEAVIHKNGKVGSYNPGQYYAVSTVEVLNDLDSLSIWEEYGECTDPDSGEPLSALNPPNGGGSVVIVKVDDNGVAWQIADAKSSNVTVSDANDNGIPDDAHADLGSAQEGDTYLMYVKFGPGLKGKSLDEATSNMCTNTNSAMGTSASGSDFDESATADLIVLPKE